MQLIGNLMLFVSVRLVFSCALQYLCYNRGRHAASLIGRGGRTRLPKFKFSANFPIGLHVILELQIKKFKTCLNRMRKIILTENPLGFDREPLLK